MQLDTAALEAALAGQGPVSLTFSAGEETFVRNFQPPEQLILLGGGHIAQPLCRFASGLEFQVTVVDDRPAFANRSRFPQAAQVLCTDFPSAIRQLSPGPGDYVAVITRGHRWDGVCLRELLSGPAPGYLGMIGSRRRTAGLLSQLAEEGFPRAALDQICTPIGLEIGALTPEEIAISILAQLIQYRRRRLPQGRKSAVLSMENVDPAVLRALADRQRGRAVVLVCETSGSTPAKSGALLVVDQNLNRVGTVGGGCSEDAAARAAFRLIGTGASRFLTVDLSNDLAAEEGMVCGGQMRLLLADLERAPEGATGQEMTP